MQADPGCPRAIEFRTECPHFPSRCVNTRSRMRSGRANIETWGTFQPLLVFCRCREESMQVKKFVFTDRGVEAAVSVCRPSADGGAEYNLTVRPLVYASAREQSSWAWRETSSPTRRPFTTAPWTLRGIRPPGSLGATGSPPGWSASRSGRSSTPPRWSRRRPC